MLNIPHIIAFVGAPLEALVLALLGSFCIFLYYLFHRASKKAFPMTWGRLIVIFLFNFLGLFIITILNLLKIAKSGQNKPKN